MLNLDAKSFTYTCVYGIYCYIEVETPLHRKLDLSNLCMFCGGNWKDIETIFKRNLDVASKSLMRFLIFRLVGCIFFIYTHWQI